MKTVRTAFPPNSILNTATRRYDYTDSYACILEDKEDRITPVEVGKAFFKSGPKWVGKLFVLRHKIVALFGLKTSEIPTNRQQLLDNFTCTPGERMGLFKVLNRTENEVILGEDDKHLDFRISLYLTSLPQDMARKELIISTTVVIHNRLGRLYFFIVKPFHKLIVPVMLKGIIKQLVASKTLKDSTLIANQD